MAQTRPGRIPIRGPLSVCLALALLTACAPDGLPVEPVGTAVTDTVTGQVTTLHQIVSDFPVEDADGTTIATEITVDLAAEYSYAIGRQNFRLRLSTGDVEPSNDLDVALETATLWPLSDVASGHTSRGWLAFDIGDASLAGAELVVTRPATIIAEDGSRLPVEEFTIPLDL